MILVEADVSEEWDSSTDWARLADLAVRAAIAESGAAWLSGGLLLAEISVSFTSDEEVRVLNATWRGRDKPTNVLSFPMIEAGEIAALAGGEGEVLLGDIVLARGVCAREAEEKGVSMRDHACHLLAHGALHLLGYDHELGEEEAEAMEETERRALAELGIADPYEIHH